VTLFFLVRSFFHHSLTLESSFLKERVGALLHTTRSIGRGSRDCSLSVSLSLCSPRARVSLSFFLSFFLSSPSRTFRRSARFFRSFFFFKTVPSLFLSRSRSSFLSNAKKTIRAPRGGASSSSSSSSRTDLSSTLCLAATAAAATSVGVAGRAKFARRKIVFFFFFLLLLGSPPHTFAHNSSFSLSLSLIKKTSSFLYIQYTLARKRW